jgi:hypothetical protein
MKRRFAAITAVLTVIAANASAQPQARAQAGQPIVHSGLFMMSPDGKTSGSAVQTGEYVGDDLAGTLTLSPCGGGGASSPGRPVSAFATDVWSMSGRVLELSEQHASVQVGWRRTRRGGQEENAPEQSTTLTLKRGERHTLETITVPASGSCEARTVALDVVFASRSELYGISEADYARGSMGGGRGGSASAGGRLPYVQGSVQRAGEGGSATAGGGAGTTHPGLRRLTADLWLVRSTPGAADQTLHVTSALFPMPVAYTFAPLTIQNATGTVTVKVEGTIEAGLSPEGEQRLHFTASRSVTTLASSRPQRDGKAAIEGSTKTTLKMPGPDEVLSFEMPPLRTADGMTLPDRFSIRVRVNAPPGR